MEIEIIEKLLKIIEKWNNSLDKRSRTAALLVDFRKLFGSADCKRLIV